MSEDINMTDNSKHHEIQSNEINTTNQFHHEKKDKSTDKHQVPSTIEDDGIDGEDEFDEDESVDNESVRGDKISSTRQGKSIHTSTQVDTEDEDEMDDDDDVSSTGVLNPEEENESTNIASEDELETSMQMSIATPTGSTLNSEDEESHSTHENEGFRPIPNNEENEQKENIDEADKQPPKVKKRSMLQSGAQSDVNAIIAARRRTGAKKQCEVCNEARNGRRAMLCSQCKGMYHSSCYRKKYNKLIHASGNRQWLCVDCDAQQKREAQAVAQSTRLAEKREREQREQMASSPDPSLHTPTSSRPRRAKSGSSGGRQNKLDDSHMHVVTVDTQHIIIEQEVARIADIALRGGKKMNALVMDRAQSMLDLIDRIYTELDTVLVSSHNVKEDSSKHTLQSNGVKVPLDRLLASNGATLPMDKNLKSETDSSHISSINPPNVMASNLDSPASSSQLQKLGNGFHAITQVSSEISAPLQSVQKGLLALQDELQDLQVASIQFEIDLIKDIKLPPPKDAETIMRVSPTGVSINNPISAGQTPTTKLGAGGGSASRSGVGAKGKSGASRLYTSAQIQKLEEWYQKCSRPESSEIHAMYQIVNCPEFSDRELQPEGISIKQIRIWFDNRRAKERLDYMRLKMKDVSTGDMDAEAIKKLKAAYIDEAKEVLEARVSRLREHGKGATPVADEADTLLLHPSESDILPPVGPSTTSNSSAIQKKRIRIDYVASVRKAVKDARDAGKSEDEVKKLRSEAIERARERLYIPYKNARQSASKPLNKEEVLHIKSTLTRLMDENAPPDELTDVVELLLTVVIPKRILIETALQKQLETLQTSHRDQKELMKLAKKLQDEFNTIIQDGNGNDDDNDEESLSISVTNTPTKVSDGSLTSKKGTSRVSKAKDQSQQLRVDTETNSAGRTGSSTTKSPDKKTVNSPDSRRPRTKFSLEMLMKLEKHFQVEDTPSKKNLEKLAKKLNAIAAKEGDELQKKIDYKQIRCWFYKRRSTNQRPQALTSADIDVDMEIASVSSSLSSSSPSSSDSDINSDSDSDDDAHDNEETLHPHHLSDNTAENSSTFANVSGNEDRAFNVKQLATIIEEYEKNPLPNAARINELARLLNHSEHKDDNMDETNVRNELVTSDQIQHWFATRRAKEREDLQKMKNIGDRKHDDGPETKKQKLEDHNHKDYAGAKKGMNKGSTAYHEESENMDADRVDYKSAGNDSSRNSKRKRSPQSAFDGTQAEE